MYSSVGDLDNEGITRVPLILCAMNLCLSPSPPPPSFLCHPQACADKLQREIKEFGFPPKFPENVDGEEEEEDPDPSDPTKRVKKV